MVEVVEVDVLVRLAEVAGVVRSATVERDDLIREACRLGFSRRQVAGPAGLSKSGVDRVVERGAVQ